MQIKETRTELREVVVGHVCDACGKRAESEDPDGWVHLTSGHSEWGNDSFESSESHDACSARCFVAIARERFEYWNAPPTLRVGVGFRDFDRDFLASLFELLPDVEPAPTRETPD